MLSRLATYTLFGIEARLVEVEVDISPGALPKTILVGLAEAAVKESVHRIERYLSRISGPLLDRIDIHIEVPPVPFRELSDTSEGTSSETMRHAVVTARKRQSARFQGESTRVNGKMKPPQIRKFCKLQPDAESLLQHAMEEMGLSARAHDKILRVSRTIADLEECEDISSVHLSEAINYRTLDRNYWQQ